ncbi:hypothetical protein G17_00109 [Escherichia phage vB_EcoM_G17]|uniref:Uncharacterized protein n=5 Tax=Asteriusvirus TaxID=2560094 RepID=A0A1C3S6A2_9CAUD|nr:hypothetical protein [Escherichia coli]YP_009101791.1 hypothetical protein PBI_121Q_204 [Escherichia phage 121Q]AXC36579.1 hypothetical protein [Escherichia phage UB]MED6573059.1 hypothetical protein [Escherichia coli O157]QBO61605.1 hypothetical protein G17_00109 [Escherichia phage vB_EcoM_G17]QDF13663.1 hypothetical protein vBEcoMphAPEC6_gp032c [Escherichia phage vB_EcoM_phAPEC6]WIL01060.1 hypothetical protein [Escherichia phage vB_EcoM_CRJP21]WNN14433.1 hypothetical protein Sharanji_gp
MKKIFLSIILVLFSFNVYAADAKQVANTVKDVIVDNAPTLEEIGVKTCDIVIYNLVNDERVMLNTYEQVVPLVESGDAFSFTYKVKLTGGVEVNLDIDTASVLKDKLGYVFNRIREEGHLKYVYESKILKRAIVIENCK